MHHAAEARVPPMLFQNCKEIVPRVCHSILGPTVNQDGPLARCCNFELCNQPAPLHLVWRALMVVIEADLAAGDYAGLGQQSVQLLERRLIGLSRRVRVNPRAGIQPRQASAALRPRIEFAANLQRLVHLRRPFANADRKHRLHARIPGAAQHGLAIVRVTGAVEVCMRINEQESFPFGVKQPLGYFSRAPSGTSSRNPASTGAPPSSDAASSMPFDSRPRIFLGARLATMTIFRPISFSGS